MGKIAIIADLHLIQQQVPKYDNIADLARLLEEIKKSGAEAICLAGDFFDEKESLHKYLHHGEGEEKRERVVQVLEKGGIQIYALRGNHDHEAPLRSTQRSLPGLFYYKQDEFSEVGGVNFYFLETRVEKDQTHLDYNVKMEKKFKELMQEVRRRPDEKRVLLMHENLGNRENSLEKKTLQIIESEFDLVLNGHEHVYQPKPFSVKNVFNLPPGLPSTIHAGRMWAHKYTKKINSTIEHVVREPSRHPFGFIILDSSSLPDISFIPFYPTVTPIYYELKVDGESLEQIHNSFEEDFQRIASDQGTSTGFIVPRVVGNVAFNIHNISEIFSKIEASFTQAHPNLALVPIRTKRVKFKDISGEISEQETPDITIEDKIERIVSSLPDRLAALNARTGTDLNKNQCERVIRYVLTQPDFFKPRTNENVNQYLGHQLEEIWAHLISGDLKKIEDAREEVKVFYRKFIQGEA